MADDRGRNTSRYPTREGMRSNLSDFVGAPPPDPHQQQVVGYPRQPGGQQAHSRQYQQQHPHSQQQQQQGHGSPALPSLRSSMQFPPTTTQDHASHHATQRRMPQVTGSLNSGSTPRMHQSQQVLSLPFPQPRSGSGSSGEAAGFFGLGAGARSGSVPPTLSLPYSSGGGGGTGAGSARTAVDVPPLNACAVPPTAAWQPLVQGYGAVPPVQDSSTSSARTWLSGQTLGQQDTTRTRSSSRNSNHWQSQHNYQGGSGGGGGGGSASPRNEGHTAAEGGLGVMQGQSGMSRRSGQQQLLQRPAFSHGAVGSTEINSNRHHHSNQQQQQQQQHQVPFQQTQQPWVVEHLKSTIANAFASSWQQSGAGSGNDVTDGIVGGMRLAGNGTSQAFHPQIATNWQQQTSSRSGSPSLAGASQINATQGGVEAPIIAGTGSSAQPQARKQVVHMGEGDRQLPGEQEMAGVGPGTERAPAAITGSRDWNALRTNIPLLHGGVFGTSQNKPSEMKGTSTTTPTPIAPAPPSGVGRAAPAHVLPIAPTPSILGFQNANSTTITTNNSNSNGNSNNNNARTLNDVGLANKNIRDSSRSSSRNSNSSNSASSKGSAPTTPPPQAQHPSSSTDKDKGSSSAGRGGKGTGDSAAAASVTRTPARRGAPTRFLSTLHDMLKAGNPHIWWETETGSVVIEDPQVFETETLIRHFPEPKNHTFYRQLAFYGFKKPQKDSKAPGRWQHPECTWKEVSCVKSLLTKKVYDQKRLENAIRITAAGGGSSAGTRAAGARAVSEVKDGGGSSSTSDPGATDKTESTSVGSKRPAARSVAETAAQPPERAAVVPKANGAATKEVVEAPSAVAPEVAKGVRSDDGDGGDGNRGDDGERGKVVIERTELEVATEAAVVRARGVGREARKQLRQSMTRGQMGRWQLEQTAKLMMEVMRLNAKLVRGLRECRARGGPPRVRRCKVPSAEVARLRLERARLKRRVRSLEDQLQARGLPLPP